MDNKNITTIGDINDVSEYIKAINDYYNNSNHCDEKKHFFFRGHSKERYKLLPNVLRNEGLKEEKEKEIVLDFHHYGASHSFNYDLDNDRISILTDMQHNGIPTRLLDWSLNPLMALFFAVENIDCSENGVVYILNPWSYGKSLISQKCNYTHNNDKKKHPKFHDSNILGRALLSTYKDDIDFIKKIVSNKYGYNLQDEELEKPFPFVSNFTNERMKHQRGVFTIYGTKYNDELKKEDLEQAYSNNYLAKITITKGAKKNIYNQLNRLYINEYSVYPDLEGMRKLIRKRGGLFNL